MNTDDLGKEPSSSTDEPALKAVRSETQEMSSAQPHIITSKSITQGDLDPTHNGTHSGASNTKSSVSDDEAADDALDAPAAVDAPSVISSPQRAARSQSRREDRRRLWFVRMPKPPEAPATTAASKDDVEAESYNIRLAHLNESAGVIRIERDAASKVAQAAQADLNQMRQDYESHKAEAEPHRTHRKKLRDHHAVLLTEFKTDYNDLPAKSEDELDQKIHDIRHDMEHGNSISTAEEKKLLARISKLNSQRSQVREYSIKSAALREAKAELTEAISGSEELEAEVQSLWEEMSTQRTIVDKHRAAENKIRAAHKQIQDEKLLVLGQRDELRERNNASQAEKQQRFRPWSDNRKFSYHIRTVLSKGAGSLTEAAHLCIDQIDMALHQLSEDVDFRNEYFELWEGQRKHPTSAYDDRSDVVGSGGGHTGGNEAEAASAERARKMIADVLAKADETVRLQRQQQEEHAQPADRSALNSTVVARQEPDTAAATAAASAAAAVAVGNAPAAAPSAKTAKRSSRPPPLVEIPDLNVHAFELPSAAVKPTTAASNVETDKQRVRDQNRAAAAEAERRKERQRKAADLRRNNAEARRLRAEQDKAAADQASKQSATASAHRAQPQPSSDVNLQSAVNSASDAIGVAAADVSSAAVAQGRQVLDGVAKHLPKPKSGSAANAAGKPRTALTKPEPRARVPARRRNALKSLQKASAKAEDLLRVATRKYWPAMQDNIGMVALLLGFVLLLVIFLMYSIL